MTVKSFRLAVIAAVIASAVAAACAGNSGSGSAVERPNRAIIAQSEMPTSGTESVYDVIQRLRPEYLRQRPQGGSSILAVFAQGQKMGDVSELKRIPASSVTLIQHYSIEQAKNKFGMQYSGGAIELTYR
jgi:hypothetical protein